eukprot:sb/3463930/
MVHLSDEVSTAAPLTSVSEYTTFVKSTSIFPPTTIPRNLAYLCCGLTEEFCELQAALSSGADKTAVLKEMGDVTWYLTAMSLELGSCPYTDRSFGPESVAPAATEPDTVEGAMKAVLLHIGSVCGRTKKSIRDDGLTAEKICAILDGIGGIIGLFEKCLAPKLGFTLLEPMVVSFASPTAAWFAERSQLPQHSPTQQQVSKPSNLVCHNIASSYGFEHRIPVLANRSAGCECAAQNRKSFHFSGINVFCTKCPFTMVHLSDEVSTAAPLTSVSEYTTFVKSTSIFPPTTIPRNLAYLCCGLTEEFCELQAALSSGGDDKTAVLKEMGDVTWYLTAMSLELGSCPYTDRSFGPESVAPVATERDTVEGAMTAVLLQIGSVCGRTKKSIRDNGLTAEKICAILDGIGGIIGLFERCLAPKLGFTLLEPMVVSFASPTAAWFAERSQLPQHSPTQQQVSKPSNLVCHNIGSSYGFEHRIPVSANRSAGCECAAQNRKSFHFSGINVFCTKCPQDT